MKAFAIVACSLLIVCAVGCSTTARGPITGTEYSWTYHPPLPYLQEVRQAKLDDMGYDHPVLRQKAIDGLIVEGMPTLVAGIAIFPFKVVEYTQDTSGITWYTNHPNHDLIYFENYMVVGTADFPGRPYTLMDFSYAY